MSNMDKLCDMLTQFVLADHEHVSYAAFVRNANQGDDTCII